MPGHGSGVLGRRRYVSAVFRPRRSCRKMLQPRSSAGLATAVRVWGCGRRSRPSPPPLAASSGPSRCGAGTARAPGPLVGASGGRSAPALCLPARDNACRVWQPSGGAAAPGASSGTAKAAKRCPCRGRWCRRLRLPVPGSRIPPRCLPGPSFLPCSRSPGCARSESVGRFGNEPHQDSPNGDFVPSRSLFASKISLFASKMRQCRDGAVCPAQPLRRFCFGFWCGSRST